MSLYTPGVRWTTQPHLNLVSLINMINWLQNIGYYRIVSCRYYQSLNLRRKLLTNYRTLTDYHRRLDNLNKNAEFFHSFWIQLLFLSALLCPKKFRLVGLKKTFRMNVISESNETNASFVLDWEFSSWPNRHVLSRIENGNRYMKLEEIWCLLTTSLTLRDWIWGSMVA